MTILTVMAVMAVTHNNSDGHDKDSDDNIGQKE